MQEKVTQLASAQWLDAARELVVSYSLKIIGVIVLLLVANVVAGWIGRLAGRAMKRRGVDAMIQGYLRSIIRAVILVFAIIACLGIFGIQTTSFAAVIGAAGLAIGLAFQGSLSHLAAGFMLLIFRPFRVGDAVNVAGQLGVIDQISMFSTTMNTFDNRRIIIPNGSVFGAVIENLTHHEERRVDVEVRVAYDASVDRTREVLEAAAAAVPGRLDKEGREPAVVLLKMGPSSIDWVVRVWAPTATFWDVHQAAVRGVKQALDDAKISIPFPQMDVHLSKDQ
jgi:small conductance mechanosensitive channel